MRSGTHPTIELGFGLPPLPEKAWRARAFSAGLASHKRRRSVQKTTARVGKKWKLTVRLGEWLQYGHIYAL